VTSVACGANGLWLLAFAASGLEAPEPFLRWPGAADTRRADDMISGRFELHLAWNMEPSERRVSGSTAGTRSVRGSAGCRRTQKGAVMGVGKKAKREAKAVRGKTKKGAGKVKHKGKKAKNAAKH
jgi:hypothetical protein